MKPKKIKPHTMELLADLGFVDVVTEKHYNYRGPKTKQVITRVSNIYPVRFKCDTRPYAGGYYRIDDEAMRVVGVVWDSITKECVASLSRGCFGATEAFHKKGSIAVLHAVFEPFGEMTPTEIAKGVKKVLDVPAVSLGNNKAGVYSSRKKVVRKRRG